MICIAVIIRMLILPSQIPLLHVNLRASIWRLAPALLTRAEMENNDNDPAHERESPWIIGKQNIARGS